MASLQGREYSGAPDPPPPLRGFGVVYGATAP
jgi:hypothetical protein